MQPVTFYTDYRHYLRDFYKACKERKTAFSYRGFLKKAGVKSPSLFLEVANGKRNLTPRTIKGFVHGLKLFKSESKYFEALVYYNQSKDPMEKLAFLEKMRGLRRRIKLKVIPMDQFEYYANWYHPVLREQACLFNWKENYKILAKSLTPPISTEEARESIKFLLKLGFLKKAADGKYLQSDPLITTGSEVVSLGVRELNRKMADLGEKAVNMFPPTERDISSLVVGISKESYALIKEEIQDFKDRVIRIAAHDNKSDVVYNMNVHLFPIAKPIDSEEDNHE